MVKGACYVRVSTDNQLENYSIEEQTARLKAYCLAKDIQVVHFYVDGGYSGGSTNRPALQQMLADIGRGVIDMVIVYKLDRLSRSQKDTLMLIEDHFLAKHVDFISVSENFDTSNPFGRAMIGILSVFAQLEKDQITERFTMGRIGRAKNGYFHGGAYAPTGYDYVDGSLIVNEYEALQVQDLYSHFLQGCSVRSCRLYMQAKYTTKYGGWKSDTLVRNVLSNELYTGKIKFKGNVYPGRHQPIISEKQFQQVQTLLHASNKDASPASRSPYKASTLLSGLIYCGKCGARFHGEHGNYSCYSRTKGDKHYVIDPNCKNKKWKIPELDSLVADSLSGLRFSQLEKSPVKSVAAPSSKCLEIIEKQIGRLIDLFQAGSISMELADQRLEALDREKSLLQNAAEISPVPAADINQPISAKELFVILMENGSLEEKRTCLSLLVDKIIVTDDDINIILKAF